MWGVPLSVSPTCWRRLGAEVSPAEVISSSPRGRRRGPAQRRSAAVGEKGRTGGEAPGGGAAAVPAVPSPLSTREAPQRTGRRPQPAMPGGAALTRCSAAARGAGAASRGWRSYSDRPVGGGTGVLCARAPRAVTGGRSRAPAGPGQRDADRSGVGGRPGPSGPGPPSGSRRDAVVNVDGSEGRPEGVQVRVHGLGVGALRHLRGRSPISDLKGGRAGGQNFRDVAATIRSARADLASGSISSDSSARVACST